jgi:hypothetical protein
LRVEGPGLRQVEGAAKAAEHPALLFSGGVNSRIGGFFQEALPLADRGLRNHLKQRTRGDLDESGEVGL